MVGHPGETTHRCLGRLTIAGRRIQISVLTRIRGGLSGLSHRCSRISSFYALRARIPRLDRTPMLGLYRHNALPPPSRSEMAMWNGRGGVTTPSHCRRIRNIAARMRCRIRHNGGAIRPQHPGHSRRMSLLRRGQTKTGHGHRRLPSRPQKNGMDIWSRLPCYRMPRRPWLWRIDCVNRGSHRRSRRSNALRGIFYIKFVWGRLPPTQRRPKLSRRSDSRVTRRPSCVPAVEGCTPHPAWASSFSPRVKTLGAPPPNPRRPHLSDR